MRSEFEDQGKERKGEEKDQRIENFFNEHPDSVEVDNKLIPKEVVEGVKILEKIFKDFSDELSEMIHEVSGDANTGILNLASYSMAPIMKCLEESRFEAESAGMFLLAMKNYMIALQFIAWKAAKKSILGHDSEWDTGFEQDFGIPEHDDDYGA